jgi:hypothetical protein
MLGVKNLATSSKTEEKDEKYNGAKEKDKLDKQYGIQKDLKKRVFMVLKAPKEGET